VDVVESTPLPSPGSSNASPGIGATVSPGPASSGGGTNMAAETFYQLQTLQQEVLELRGLVEEQSFELKRLKQQRMDDYLDLDRRVSALTKGGVASSAAGEAKAPVVATNAQPSASASGPVAANLGLGSQGSPEQEAKAYRAAYDLLKQRQVDQSITAFSDLLIAYPAGRYAGNAQYWLGEIYLLKNDYESARQWFTRLLDTFDGHRKVPDAQFKLGKVYHLLGDKEKAQLLLEQVAATNADAARLAKNYLAQHFQ